MRIETSHDNANIFPAAVPNVAVRDLTDLTQPAELADYLRAEREALMSRAREGALLPDSGIGGIEMTREFSDLMDAVILRMYEVACAKHGCSPVSLPLCVVATGGYGRRELCPFSDVDITFIPQTDGDPMVDRVIRDMFTLVMDTCISRCGLEVGYAYRLLEDCVALDHQTACGLLDARLIVGSNRLFIQFEDAFWMGLNPVDFIFTKTAERETTLEKFGYSPRVVEPHIKEGPGGLRDLQTSVWLTQAKEHLVSARVRGERSFSALVRTGHLTAQEAANLAQAKEFLFRVRTALHVVVGAERDELVITRQEDVATMLGYLPGATPAEAPPVERFMADLFPALLTIRRTARHLMRRIEQSRLFLGIGLDCKRRQIVPANDALGSDDPLWMLWACELAQRYGMEFCEALERAIIPLAASNPPIHDSLQAGEVFTRLLKPVGKVYHALQRMADLGIINWVLPELGRIMDLIPYDPSHDHTIGQHSLFVVQNIDSLLSDTAHEDHAEMRHILEELAHPEELMMAALLHDAGKAVPGRPHSEASEEMAEAVCKRFDWSPEATANVKFLTRNHLVMAETSRLRDIQMDETIRDFTAVVDDIERLNMLYLLTYADTRAVGEGVWTPVRGRFLRDLWRRTSAVLMDEEPAEYDDAAIARTRRRLLKDLSLENLPDEEVAEHVQAMPSEYLLNHTLNQIALHMGFIRKVREGAPVIDFHDEKDAAFTELTICTYDDPQPGLLAKIIGVLFSAELDVHTAQVITRVTDTDRIALDTLWVDFRGHQLSPGKRREITTKMTAVLTGQQSVQEVISTRRSVLGGSRHAAPAAASKPLVPMVVRNDLSNTLTVLEIAGPDVRGVFYRICDGISRLGWDIRSARVSTWQGEARISFYVSGARVLTEAECMRELHRVLAESEPVAAPPPGGRI